MGVVEQVRRLPRNLAAGLVVLGGLALAYVWAYPIDPLVAPSTTPPFELWAVRLDALRFLNGCVVACCAILLLFVRCPRLAAGALLISAWGILPTLWLPGGERSADGAGAVLRVLSVNLAVSRAETARVLEAVREADADVLFFQEYTPARRAEFREALAALYPVRHERARTDAFGMAIYARVALKEIESFHLGESRTPQFRLEVALGEATVVLYGIHLLPISGPLYAQQRLEFVDLLARLARERLPTALVGDFNLVDHSVFGAALHARGFLEAQALAGEGRAASWPVQLMQMGIPGIRIDHIYAGTGLTCTEAWLGQATGSDHLPVGACLTPTGR